MMAQAGNNSFNTLLSNLKLKERKDPRIIGTVALYLYDSTEDRLGRFLQRMEGQPEEESGST